MGYTSIRLSPAADADSRVNGEILESNLQHWNLLQEQPLPLRHLCVSEALQGYFTERNDGHTRMIAAQHNYNI